MSRRWSPRETESNIQYPAETIEGEDGEDRPAFQTRVFTAAASVLLFSVLFIFLPPPQASCQSETTAAAYVSVFGSQTSNES